MSARCAEQGCCRASTLRIRGPIHPYPDVCAAAHGVQGNKTIDQRASSGDLDVRWQTTGACHSTTRGNIFMRLSVFVSILMALIPTSGYAQYFSLEAAKGTEVRAGPGDGEQVIAMLPQSWIVEHTEWNGDRRHVAFWWDGEHLAGYIRDEDLRELTQEEALAYEEGLSFPDDGFSEGSGTALSYIDESQTLVELQYLNWSQIMAYVLLRGGSRDEILESIRAVGRETFEGRAARASLMQEVEWAFEQGAGQELADARIVIPYNMFVPPYDFETNTFEFCRPSAISIPGQRSINDWSRFSGAREAVVNYRTAIPLVVPGVEFDSRRLDRCGVGVPGITVRDSNIWPRSDLSSVGSATISAGSFIAPNYPYEMLGLEVNEIHLRQDFDVPLDVEVADAFYNIMTTNGNVQLVWYCRLQYSAASGLSCLVDEFVIGHLSSPEGDMLRVEIVDGRAVPSVGAALRNAGFDILPD